MASKDNIDRPKAEREYFDRPIKYQKEGFGFTPHHRRPVYLLGQAKNIDEVMSNYSRINLRSKSPTMARNTGYNLMSSFGSKMSSKLGK
jgi:hypothetical protein